MFIVKRRIKMKIALVMLSIFIFFSSLCLAGDIKKSQGVVFLVKENIMIVQERSFICNESTQFVNEKGDSTTLNSIRVKDVVSIESRTEQGANIALKIVVLKRGL
jgi:hypothetical protein